MSDKHILTDRQLNILSYFKWEEKITSGLIINSIKPIISIATLKRDLAVLCEQNYIVKSGLRKSSEYTLTGYGLIHRHFNLGSYYLIPETDRNIIKQFNQELFAILKNEPIFTDKELLRLEQATNKYRQNAINASEVIYKKELERFVIEFSWKSSQIEGNTYTLLETEMLIKEGLKKNNRSDFETTMILNHKKAYEFLLSQTKNESLALDRSTLEKIHSLVVNELGVNIGLRKASIGISGSLYRPLSTTSQIKEQLDSLINCINSKTNIYDKALIMILGESYLQPFEDGNKRTARVVANGLLLQAGYAPLSYRSINEQDYKEACLIFYEQNSIEPFKNLFIEQYIFAANNYNMAKTNSN
ncbi:MAG: Fic family protein [Ignavibacteria bacterium]|nr:Fic family protein [Ignavibacteria bacterium]